MPKTCRILIQWISTHMIASQKPDTQNVWSLLIFQNKQIRRRKTYSLRWTSSLCTDKNQKHMNKWHHKVRLWWAYLPGLTTAKVEFSISIFGSILAILPIDLWIVKVFLGGLPSFYPFSLQGFWQPPRHIAIRLTWYLPIPRPSRFVGASLRKWFHCRREHLPSVPGTARKLWKLWPGIGVLSRQVNNYISQNFPSGPNLKCKKLPFNITSSFTSRPPKKHQ